MYSCIKNNKNELTNQGFAFFLEYLTLEQVKVTLMNGSIKYYKHERNQQIKDYMTGVREFASTVYRPQYQESVSNIINKYVTK